jgi:predicted MFS family arabinose efflux permease
LSRSSAFRHLFIAFSVWGFFGQGILQWQPTFFLRSHGLTTGELGNWFAVVHGVGGLVGAYWGGELASRYAANNERLQLIGDGVAYVLLAGLGAVIYLATDHRVAFGVMLVYAIISNATGGPLFATIQTLVEPRMRALAVASMYFSCNLIGLGLGPLAVGVLSDGLAPQFAENSLRYALLAFTPGYMWCAWHFWRASRTVIGDMAKMQEDRTQVEVSGVTVVVR